MTPRTLPTPPMFVTVTPNPSLDRTIALPHLVRGEVHRAGSVRVDPGGKGVNVARALASAGAGEAVEYGPQMPESQHSVTMAADAPELQLLAARPAWVRVTTSDGTVLLEKIMDAGERFSLSKLEEPPVLRTGNSGAIYFAVNGKTYGPAAPGPQVVKNIRLSPDALTGTFALADLNADPELAQALLHDRNAPANAADEGQDDGGIEFEREGEEVAGAQVQSGRLRNEAGIGQHERGEESKGQEPEHREHGRGLFDGHAHIPFQ